MDLLSGRIPGPGLAGSPRPGRLVPRPLAVAPEWQHRGIGSTVIRRGLQDWAFQVVRLSAYELWMTGTFVYSDTFWRHDCVGVRDRNVWD